MTSQLALPIAWGDQQKSELDPYQLLADGADLIILYSGGKDSQAMAMYLMRLKQNLKWPGKMYLLHQDLGEMEWYITNTVNEMFAEKHDIKLVVQKGDLLARMWKRHETRPDSPPFPSAQARYCTSDEKRGPSNKHVTAMYPDGRRTILLASGIRAEESPARAKKSPFSMRMNGSSPYSTAKQRYVYDWYPIFDWKEAEVWQTIGVDIEAWRAFGDWLKINRPIHQHISLLMKNNVPFHPAYALGNERLSCAICILASLNDIINGCIYNPKLLDELIKLEIASGFTFRKNLSLQDLKRKLEENTYVIPRLQLLT